MLDRARIVATLPASDLERAKRFYAHKLGLTAVQESEVGVRYRCGSAEFLLYPSASAGTARHTLAGWEVDHIEPVVEELRARGVTFEEYDLPGLQTVNGIAEVATERHAWFRDSEGNILALAEIKGSTGTGRVH